MKLQYNIHEIDKQIIQIFGEVNGFAYKRKFHNRESYIIDIGFIINKKYYKVRTCKEDETMSSISDIIARINEIITSTSSEGAISNK